MVYYLVEYIGTLYIEYFPKDKSIDKQQKIPKSTENNYQKTLV